MPTCDIKKEILLPEYVYAVEGMELNVYLNNLCLPSPDLYCMNVVSDRGILREKYWRYIPGEEKETKCTVSRIDYDANILNSKACTVLSCRKDDKPKRKIKCLFIGDSLTHASIYTQQFSDLCTQTGLDVELIGTHCVNNNVHEGYGGWSLKSHYENETSPFLFDGRFSFEKYMAKNGFDHVDFVFFFLGPNDIVFMENDEQMIKKAEYNLETYGKIIENIHEYDKNIHIGITTMLPPSSSQDAFGWSYGTKYPRYRYIRNTHYYNLYMINAFDRGQYDNVGVVPLHVMFDTENSVSYDQIKPHSHSDESIRIQNNAVHPVAAGYAQVADGFYFYLRNKLSEK